MTNPELFRLTAWTPSNPFGPSFDPNALEALDETKDAISKAIGILTTPSPTKL